MRGEGGRERLGRYIGMGEGVGISLCEASDIRMRARNGVTMTAPRISLFLSFRSSDGHGGSLQLAALFWDGLSGYLWVMGIRVDGFFSVVGIWWVVPGDISSGVGGSLVLNYLSNRCAGFLILHHTHPVGRSLAVGAGWERVFLLCDTFCFLSSLASGVVTSCFAYPSIKLLALPAPSDDAVAVTDECALLRRGGTRRGGGRCSQPCYNFPERQDRTYDGGLDRLMLHKWVSLDSCSRDRVVRVLE
jgi:hypothetical protein